MQISYLSESPGYSPLGTELPPLHLLLPLFQANPAAFPAIKFRKLSQ